MADYPRSIDRPGVAPTRERAKEWAQTGAYCQSCGGRDIRVPVNDFGDYYHDVTGYCGACGASQCCQGSVTAKDLVAPKEPTPA